MPETSLKITLGSTDNAGNELTSFPALSVDPRVGISRSAWETDDWLFLLPIIGVIEVLLKMVALIYFLVSEINILIKFR